MNPMHLLLFIAPATVIGAILFVGVFDQLDDTAEIERETIHIEKMEFDQDFASAWNGGNISAVDQQEITQKKVQLQELKDLASKAKAQKKEQLARFAEELQGSLDSERDVTKDIANLKQQLNN